MQTDPVQEWQRLTAEYREKSREELIELALDFADLTEAAQQALRSEMRSRGLGDPESPSVPTLSPTPSSENAAPHARQAEIDGDGAHDYTWKTELCVLSSREEAMQLQEALRRAGIESWFSSGGSTTSFVPTTSRSVTFGDIRLLVAADQLDQAHAIAAQPIPQEIVDESKMEIPEFEAPTCPKCGAEDPTLESVEPANLWVCENCGNQWSDAESEEETPAPAAS